MKNKKIIATCSLVACMAVTGVAFSTIKHFIGADSNTVTVESKTTSNGKKDITAGLKKAIEGNASFVVELYHRMHTYEEFQEEAADIFGYRLIVCFLLEMYKLANKPLLTIGEDYNVVMNIVDRTKECCSNLNIFSITKEKLEEIMNNPDSRKNIDYGVDANIDYKGIICDDIVIDSIPYYIAFIVKNPLRTTNLVLLNEVNVYYKPMKYIELKESIKKKGGI